MSGSGNAGQGAGSTQPDPPAGGINEEKLKQFSRECTGIVEKYQRGQCTFSEGMVQIALELCKLQTNLKEAENVARHFYGLMEQVCSSLVRNGYTASGKMTMLHSYQP